LIELVTRDFALLREHCSQQGPIAAVVVHVSPRFERRMPAP
jgi:hypothetical protein